MRCLIVIVLLMQLQQSMLQLYEENFNKSALIYRYEQMICDNEPTCTLMDHFAIPNNRHSLDKRDCLCDEDCVLYKDCCYDSPFYEIVQQMRPQIHYCAPQINVYMKTNCPRTWPNDLISEQCEKSTQPLQSDDIALILPVTNARIRTTYGNAYCAQCHHDHNYQLWNLVPSCVPVGNAPSPDSVDTTPPPPTPTSLIPYNPIRLYIHLVRSQSTKGDLQTIRLPLNIRLNTNSDPANPAAAPPISVSLQQPNLQEPTNINFGANSTSSANFQSTLSFDNVNPDPEASNDGAGGSRSARRIDNGIDELDYNDYAAPLPATSQPPPQLDRTMDQIWKSAKYDRTINTFVSIHQGVKYHCQVGVQLPDNLVDAVRACVPHLVDSCPPRTDPVVAHYCREFTSIVYNKYSRKAYKNKFCAFCHLELRAYLTGCLPPDPRFPKNYQRWPKLGGIHGGVNPCSRPGVHKLLKCMHE